MAYTEAEARKIVLEAGIKLIEEKLVARTWGNISARISDSEFIITPSGMAYETLREEDLVKVKISDCSYEGNIKPSSEKGIHAAAYALRPECNFVIHTHQFYASTICAARKSTSFAPCAGYGLPGTKKLKKEVTKCLLNNKNQDMFLMANHGALVLGKTFEDAFARSKELETRCKDLFDSRVQLKALAEPKMVEQHTYPYADVNTSAFVTTYLLKGNTLRSYIDDFAQIVGPKARYCSNGRAVDDFFAGRNAVLVKDVGAVSGSTVKEDVEAISAIVEKNCAAALYVQGKKPLGLIDTNLQRYIYVHKYSKLKK